MPLKRDYQQTPLKKLKANTPTGYAFEKPFGEDLEELYINQNKSQPELCRYFGVTRRILQGWIKSFGLKKDPFKRIENSSASIRDKTPDQYKESARKAKETKLKKYCDENFNNRKQSRETCLEKFGVDNPNRQHLTSVVIDLISDKDKLEAFIKQHGILNATELANKIGMSEPQVARYIVKYGLKCLFDYSKSSIEKEIKHWASLFYRIETNVKIPNTNLEIDIFIPELNIGIEVNGNYWHSELKRDRLYHKKKSEEAAKNGIFIYHIFEYEWTAKCEQIKAQLKNLLGKNDTKIYARKCDVRVINNVEKQRFLDENHLQGNDSSSVKLGLFYEDELVSVMTFCKPRFNKKYEWELSRFCSDWGCNVVGGASKLFSYFIKHYAPKSVISYSNNAHTRGELYEKLGFKLIGESNPDYVWFKNGKIVPRYQAQKHRLLKQGYQGDSESEIMHGLGYYRIYDCGNKVWVYEKKMLTRPLGFDTTYLREGEMPR